MPMAEISKSHAGLERIPSAEAETAYNDAELKRARAKSRKTLELNGKKKSRVRANETFIPSCIEAF